MAHKFVKEIDAGQSIDEVFMVRDPILRSTTKGDFYIAMYLSDKTGEINGRMWQANEEVYASLPNPGFVHIQGRSELYRNNLQVIVNNIAALDSERVNLNDYLASTERDVDEMFDEVREILHNIQNEQLMGLAVEYLADEELMEKFCRAPGGMKLHHNYLGGLLEHTHDMLCAAQSLLSLYPQVQPDLVLAGIFIHDMGKVDELSYDMGFSYTDSGQLIGHISKSLLMLHSKADALKAKGQAIDDNVLDALGHIILSHHGQYEFGSPKLPATLEAFMVNYIDNLDAKMNQVNSAIEQERGESNWTGWQQSLATRLYRGKLKQ